MDKRTVIAIVLSVVVITIGFMIQGIMSPPPEEVPSAEQAQEFQQTEPIPQEEREAAEIEEAIPEGVVRPVPEEGISEKERVFKNNLIEVTMSPKGGTITSFRLLEHLNEGEPVEMIYRGQEEQLAFSLRFGGVDAPREEPLYNFEANVQNNVFEFYRDFYVSGNEDEPFRIIKRYTFKPNEYMFQHDVIIEHSVNKFIPLNFNGLAYTLSVGPQIGPEFENLDGRNDYRRFIAYVNGKRKDTNLRPEESEQLEERAIWAGIVGKYFSLIGVPDATNYQITYSTENKEGIPQGAQVHYSRPLIKSSRNTDSFRFYIGPRTSEAMGDYNNPEDNGFGLRDLNLDEAVESRFLLGWLENILKFFLQLFYRLIPNYGVAIILLTLLVKAVMYPLTRKSSQSTKKMQELAPKIQEIKDKYKDNQQKMNQETAELYKKEGVNPIGGCLPLLLQMPFFLAMYGLFNNHFDLRGATFIPGWINDLSQPESILNFGSFTIPLLGWNDIRLLPIIFLTTQLLSSKLTQAPGSQTGKQAKFMALGLPIVFFFILYNLPSGLLVYWIVSNILTAGQQFYINRYAHASNSGKGDSGKGGKNGKKKR